MNRRTLSNKSLSLGMHLVSTNQGWTLCRGTDLLGGSHFKTLEEVRTFLYGPADAPIALPADLCAGYLSEPHMALETHAYVPALQAWQDKQRRAAIEQMAERSEVLLAEQFGSQWD